jgi:hypothetical protein
MAIDVVVIAFNIGLYVTDVAQRVDPTSALEQSWSIIVPGSMSREAVKSFCEQAVSSLPSRDILLL